MEYAAFICKMKEKVQEKMGKEVQVGIRHVIKNNGLCMEGLVLSKENHKISPVIYLEPFYEQYQKGIPIQQLIEEVRDIYEESKGRVFLESNFYQNYTKIQPRILCKLIHYEKNRTQMKELPHVRCMDLAVVFYYLMEQEEIANGTILIHKSHLDMWGITERQLYETARNNTLRLLPYTFHSMREILTEHMEVSDAETEWEDGQEEELPMYVLSNSQCYLGAVHIIYDQVLTEIGRRLQDDFYILPSSIHECIIVPVHVNVKKEELQNMVMEINQTQVLPEEVLSNQVYLYEREIHRLSM